MGYTNYIEIKKNINVKNITVKDIETEFTAAKQEIRQLIYFVQTQKKDIVLDYIYNPEYISFNGDERNGLDHETFYLHETYELFSKDFNFCKTARKPYDQVVVAAMCILKSHLYNVINIDSDGYSLNKYIDQEIHDGYNLYKEFKKYSINPFTLTLKQLFK